jgi:hypothetical protein
MADIFSAAVRSTFAGVDFVNVLHVSGDSGSGHADPLDVATAVWSWLGADYRACLNSAYTVREVTAEKLVGGHAVSVGVHEVNLAGTLSCAGVCPRELALLVRLQSTHAGRRGKGRMFLPSPLGSDALSSQDIWSTSHAYWTAAGTLSTLLTTGGGTFGGIAIAFGVYSRKDDALYPIAGVNRDVRPHWLRSRMTAP